MMNELSKIKIDGQCGKTAAAIKQAVRAQLVRNTMKLKFVFVLLTISTLVFAQNVDESALFNMSKSATQSSCDNEINYKELFSLSTLLKYKGAATMEWLSEINETVFFNCPEGFLINLSLASDSDQNKILEYFGIVNPPWEIAAVLKLYENNSKLSNLVNGTTKSEKIDTLCFQTRYKYLPVRSTSASCLRRSSNTGYLSFLTR